MPNKIQFSKELRERSKGYHRTVFAIGFKDCSANCGTQVYAPNTTWEEAEDMLNFCSHIASARKTPAEAFEIVYGNLVLRKE